MKEAGSDRAATVAALREISLLLRLAGKDPFRARAYEKAAQSIAELNQDLSTLVARKGLTEVKGIGQSLAALIEELMQTGRSSLLDRLRAELPAGILELSRLRGLTLEKIKTLEHKLGIRSIAELRKAAEEGKLREVPGFGSKTEQNLLDQITHRDNENDKDDGILLLHALRVGQSLVEHVRAFRGIIDVDLAGSVRRWKETVSIVRVVASVDKSPTAVIEHFLSSPLISGIENREEECCSVTVIEGIRAAFSVTTPLGYAALLFKETGSKAHVERMAALAASKGIHLTTDRKRTKNKDAGERGIYRRLGMQYIPPELREGDGEIEDALAGRIADDLVGIDDIQGMTHCHTVYSDGKNTIEEMARAAESVGMEYITITDHSPTAHYAAGVTVDRLKRQWDEISRVQQKVNIKLLRGTESDILSDGALDYPDSVLEQFDVIIASIHNRYKLDEAQTTNRILAAMRNPFFKVWGHPLGRLLKRRPPIACRMDRILDGIAESKAAIELNGDPHRLDLEPRWTKEALRRGIKLIISTDAHSISDLANLKFGIGIARRSGARAADVLNCLSTEAFRLAVKP